MIDLNFHPLRKALQLSLNEMAVLKEVYELSNNTRFNGWCVKSRTKIAESLDLSRQSVINYLNTLQIKGYVDYDKELGMCRPTDMIRELAQERENIGIMIKTEGYEIMSIKLAEMVKSKMPKKKEIKEEIDEETWCQNNLQVSKNFTGVSKNLTVGVKNFGTYSISLSKSKEDISTKEETSTLQVDVLFSEFVNIYSGTLTDANKRRFVQAEKEWKKLTHEEKVRAVDFARETKEMNNPPQFVGAPDLVLKSKRFLEKPHRHVASKKTSGSASDVAVAQSDVKVDEYGITEEERRKHYYFTSKEDMINYILSGDERKIPSFQTYLFTCEKFGLEQKIKTAEEFYRPFLKQK